MADAPSLHEYCRARGIALIAYAPLGSGRLARRAVAGAGAARARLEPALVAPQRRGFGAGPDAARLAPLLDALADAAGPGGAPAHAALRWLVAHPGVIAIPGCKTAAQVAENMGARRVDGARGGLGLAELEGIGAAGLAAAGVQPARARRPVARSSPTLG